ncbi:MAG: hypothetical protein M0R47_20405 [Methylobacter sp.]|uniref:hypothetical protein n=1 Tax=Methylobacter sp. TaxID=2051955 RepID=UPI0025CC7F49|nr:hypothetical protein [Methylobacter sp.]MCK9622884.1 hypothetical protein [Methylobacter sp.]
MAQLFTNNAAGLLNASIASTDLSLTLQSGQGAEFPAVGGSDFFLVTLFSLVGSVEVNHEIIKVTARVGDTFTIVRGQEGTNPGNWSVGTNVQLRVTAGALSSFITEASASLKIASNLNDVANVTTARTNLGLGTAATQASTAFEPANANIQSHIGNTSNPHTVTKTQIGLSNVTNDAQLKISSNLSDLASASTARTNLGLGSLALSNSVESSITSSFCFRNKIINGNFDIWQRGISQTSSGYGSDDRWNNINTGSTKTNTQQTFSLGQTEVPGNPKYFSSTVVTSVAGSTNNVSKVHSIEGVALSSGKTMILSFWAKADTSKNIAVDFGQIFGTGGSPTPVVSGIGVTTFSLSTTWQKFTTTVTFPSITGSTLGTNNDSYYFLQFWFDAGSAYNARTNNLGQQSGTFDIAQVQLEEGTIATPFEQRPLQIELSLCQRYFEIISGVVIVTPNIFKDFYCKVQKRAAPVISNIVIYTGTGATLQSASGITRIYQETANSVDSNFTAWVSSEL